MRPVDTLDPGKCARISPPGHKEKPGLGVFFAFLFSFELKKEVTWLMNMWLRLAYGPNPLRDSLPGHTGTSRLNQSYDGSHKSRVP